MKETLTELVAKIGENISVRRAVALSVNPGVVAAYVHNAPSPELGKIGVLVALKSTADKTSSPLSASSSPCISRRRRPRADARTFVAGGGGARTGYPAELARQSGKPENVIEKMIEGRMRKFYEETVLLRRLSSSTAKHKSPRCSKRHRKDLGAPVRSRALSASRWARASKRSKATSPTKSNKMAGH